MEQAYTGVWEATRKLWHKRRSYWKTRLKKALAGLSGEGLSVPVQRNVAVR